jgi:hypothetical protein
MNRIAVFFLFGSGILIGLSSFLEHDELIPAYIAALILVLVPLYLVVSSAKRKNEESIDDALELMKEAQNLRMARKEVKAKIPKNSRRRESQAAHIGATKIGSARSMAVLVRKPRLREKILEICDFADMVLETIRHMPADTPAAVAFAENHLTRLNEALERCFEMSKHEEYKQAPASLDAQEIECFSTFITAFKKQQDNILIEGKNF